MKSNIVLTGLLLWAFGLHAQQANYKLADKFLMTRMGNVVFSRSVEPYFIGKGDTFWYAYKTAAGKRFYLVNPVTGKQAPLFDNETMAAQISTLTGTTCNPDDLNLGFKFADDGKSFTFSMAGKYLEYDLSTRRCHQIPAPQRQPWQQPSAAELMYNWAPDSTCAVFSLRHDIWLKKKGEADSAALRLTYDGTEYFSYSDDESGAGERVFSTKACWVKGTNRLFVIREDHRGQQTLPVVNNLAGRPSLSRTAIGSSPFYIMPGDKIVTRYELSLIDPVTAEITKVDLEKWQDQKLKLLHVAADGKYLYLQRVRRTCDELDICRVDILTGKVTVLLNEVCKPCFSDRQQSFTMLNHETEFLWWSERTGWGHYYLYRADGTFEGAVTTGTWMADRIVRMDTQRRELLLIGHGREVGRNPYYAFLYKAHLDGDGNVELLTPEDANHTVTITPSGRYFIDTYSRVDLAPVSVLRDRNGKLIRRLAEVDLSALLATGWKAPERFTVKAADGVTELYGTMWKPYDFDSTRRYPIISYVYPGPTHEALDLDFTITGNHNGALAQVGFIVVNFGHRGGSPLRDHAYRTFGHGNIRDYALADDKTALEQLAARHPYIDLEHVGIFGHSAGGLMSLAALCTYPDFYKAAVASSGNHDNRIYNQAWVETFHGVREKIPTNMELAKNLKGHLLLISGDQDDNVHPAHTLRMADALIKAGKQFDMYILPGQGHIYKGDADLFFRRKIWFHFGKYLLGDHSSDYFINMEDFNN